MIDLTSLFQAAGFVGLLYSVFTIAIGLSFRVVNYPDLTLEGSAVFGGAVSFLVLAAGAPIWMSLLAGAAAGAVGGLLTASQQLYLGVSKLLSGIITTSVLYSINIRLLGGRANARFGDAKGLFDRLNPGGSPLTDIFIVGSCVAVLVLGVGVLFRTRLGLLLRTLGDNQRYLSALGENPKLLTLCGLAFSNAIVGFGGALLVHSKRICDVNMSFGLLVSALAAMVLGETIWKARSMWQYVASNVIGTLVYNLAIGAVLFSWSNRWESIIMSSDVRLFSGLLLLVPIMIMTKRRHLPQLFRSDW